MNIKHYEEIFELFKEYHPYMSSNVADYRPKGDLGIRITMTDGTCYDFDKMNKGLRKAQVEYHISRNDITDNQCRESFSRHLLEMMDLRGYNQQTLSEYTGISKGSINSYINKAKTPSITNLRRIAYALDCSIAELLD